MGSRNPSGSWGESKLLPLLAMRPLPHGCPSISQDFRRRPKDEGSPTPRRKNAEAGLREIEIYFFCCIFQTSH